MSQKTYILKTSHFVRSFFVRKNACSLSTKYDIRSILSRVLEQLFDSSTFSTKVSTFFLHFSLLTGTVFSVKIATTSNSNAMTGNSTPRRGMREWTAGESPPKAQAKAPLECGQEMARRFPTVTGFESKTQCVLNSGGNTDSLFALSQWLRAFLIFRPNTSLSVSADGAI